MNASLLSLPKFHSGQKVEFIGKEGIIKNYRPQSGSWVYLLEMPMGLEPEMGRVGYETMIWLSEVDIYSPFNNSFHNKIRNHEYHELKMPFLQVAKAIKHHSNDNN
ncbi:MAG: hypothetical protein RMZ42_19950 [Nostoc sp. DedQUE05]|uniref:hypothetical protein n=1 Tax=Nostoc sp. DedQUE05 TaxID=3075391 RepID=UPI002AD3DDFD|nr:hypothetical protein [Nostoc sp. DedQUE05]MDZ8094178.1 hypothetical protein [Nostoc sp. DedQUE05]